MPKGNNWSPLSVWLSVSIRPSFNANWSISRVGSLSIWQYLPMSWQSLKRSTKTMLVMTHVWHGSLKWIIIIKYFLTHDGTSTTFLYWVSQLHTKFFELLECLFTLLHYDNSNALGNISCIYLLLIELRNILNDDRWWLGCQPSDGVCITSPL